MADVSPPRWFAETVDEEIDFGIIRSTPAPNSAYQCESAAHSPIPAAPAPAPAPAPASGNSQAAKLKGTTEDREEWLRRLEKARSRWNLKYAASPVVSSDGAEVKYVPPGIPTYNQSADGAYDPNGADAGFDGISSQLQQLSGRNE